MEQLRRVPQQLLGLGRTALRPVEAVANRVTALVEGRGVGELTPEAYLERLSPVDRANVTEIVDLASTLRGVAGVRIGVLAVGSTVRPPEQNFRPIRDIDLRVLNSAPADSEERKAAVEAIRRVVRGCLTGRGVKFREEDATIIQARKSEWIDLYNCDPSFITTPQLPDGQELPLHISISGVDNGDLDWYVGAHRKGDSHFVVLLHDK